MTVFKNILFIIKNYKDYLTNKFIKRIGICGAPVFIVDCGHSGTSLLLAILGSHSKIYAIPFESKIAYKSNKQKYLNQFNRLTIATGKTRWIEKTPKHTYVIDKLIDLCPDCKIILMLRDGRDVVYSFKTRFGDIAPGITAWTNDNKAGEIFWNHSNVYVLRYETIIEDFESSITKVLNFIGEEFEPDMKEFHEIPKYYYTETIKKPSSAYGKNHDQFRNWQINQPLFDGRGKWRVFTEKEKNIIKNLANDMLIKYSYVQDDNW